MNERSDNGENGGIISVEEGNGSTLENLYTTNHQLQLHFSGRGIILNVQLYGMNSYLKISFRSSTFSSGYWLSWLGSKKTEAYVSGPAFTCTHTLPYKS